MHESNTKINFIKFREFSCLGMRTKRNWTSLIHYLDFQKKKRNLDISEQEFYCISSPKISVICWHVIRSVCQQSRSWSLSFYKRG